MIDSWTVIGILPIALFFGTFTLFSLLRIKEGVYFPDAQRGPPLRSYTPSKKNWVNCRICKTPIATNSYDIHEHFCKTCATNKWTEPKPEPKPKQKPKKFKPKWVMPRERK